MLAVFLASIWSLSYFVGAMLQKDMERMLGDQQLSTVSLLAENVNQELGERLDALKTVAATVSPATLGNPAEMEAFLVKLPVLRSFFNASVIAVQFDGAVAAEVPRSASPAGAKYRDIDAITAALTDGRSGIGQPVMDSNSQSPVFGMATPIRNAQGQVIGALAGMTNLRKSGFLDLLSEHRYGKTGGYMLVSPQHRVLVTATGRGHAMDALTAPGIDPLVDRFVAGYESYGRGQGVAGGDVLAAAKGVPVAGWYVEAALPAEEAFAPIYALQQRMLQATLVLTLLAGVLVWWMLRRQLAPMLSTAKILATMSRTDQAPKPLPIHRYDEVGQLIGGFNHLLETLAKHNEVGRENEEALRIAAVAFDAQEGIFVTNERLDFLRVNWAFTKITGFSPQDVHGESLTRLKSPLHGDFFYETVWSEALRLGAWQGDMWLKRKNGTDFPGRVSITAVKERAGRITHYVGNITDATHSQLQEQQRLRNEAAHRDALVREVHHRIKNNLQGITGMLRQFAHRSPEMAEPINQAIGQIRGISVIHGLQGRSTGATVRLCELTVAIAEDIQNLWQTPVTLEIPADWEPCTVVEREAVPIALVLHELILNAVKHGGKAQGQVRITLRKGAQADVVHISIANAGTLSHTVVPTGVGHGGRQLIAALMPHNGARLVTVQQGSEVVAMLEVASPVISLELKEFA